MVTSWCFMGSYGDLMGFYGDLMMTQWVNMVFIQEMLLIYKELMVVCGDLMGFEWVFILVTWNSWDRMG